MANNNNLRNVPWVSSDLAKQKVVAPPRNKRLEKSLYFYKTSETIVDVESGATNSKVISPVFDKEVPFKSTTPLQFDIGKPKFPAVSDSQTWASQINGYIYSEININTDLYNFMSFSLLQDDTISRSVKYRIVDHHPFFDQNGKFLYATIVLVRDTNKTIPGFDRITWQLSNKLIFDKKTKYAKIVLPPRAQIYPRGAQISVVDDSGVRKNTGFTVNSTTPLGYKFIKIRGVNPYLFDDLSLENFQEEKRRDLGGFGRGTSIDDGVLKQWINESGGGIIGLADHFPFGGNKVTPDKIVCDLGSTDIDETKSSIRDYFSGAFTFTGRSESIITQKELSESDLTNWLSGNTAIDSELVPNDTNQLTADSSFQKIIDLDKDSENDRKYFVVTKKTDLTKVGVKFNNDESDNVFTTINRTSKSVYIDKNVKLTLLKATDIETYYQEPQEPIVIEIELSIAGKNPEFDLSVSGIDDFKLTTYDENHNIILNAVNIETEWKFNNSNRLTKAQL